jgi:AcrR family transcriptional regulator
VSDTIASTTETRPAKKASARERILAVANELFYREGVYTVGIDRIIEEAGVAKASLYNSFRN